MIDKVLKSRNLSRAITQVVSNDGAAGIDQMPVDELRAYFKREGASLQRIIIQQKYAPQAIKGVRIPKGNGKTRLLGIPSSIDRVLQQAVSQAITPHFEYEFKEQSFGFRPNKNAQQAVLRAQEHIHAGYRYIVDVDLKDFFDEVDHALLLELIFRKVKCPITLRLIRKWLRAPILIDGKLHKRRKGIPQGSPLSPLLSNILLHELDCYLTAQGWRFVRYADDFSVYARGGDRAETAMRKLRRFLTEKLHLQINEHKSGIRRPSSFTLLGYGFTSAYKKGVEGEYQLIVSEKAWKKLKQSVKECTRKTTPMTITERVAKLKAIQRGWLNYFRLANIAGKLQRIDGWLRNRLRYCIWKAWKKPERKRKNLIRLGVAPPMAYAWSRTRKGGWAIAQSPILTSTITLARLAKRGYESMEEH
ncbi:MAG: group II intron reverse transcriptase/maturase, partial [Acinetobacter pittii]